MANEPAQRSKREYRPVEGPLGRRPRSGKERDTWCGTSDKALISAAGGESVSRRDFGRGKEIERKL